MKLRMKGEGLIFWPYSFREYEPAVAIAESATKAQKACRNDQCYTRSKAFSDRRFSPLHFSTGHSSPENRALNTRQDPMPHFFVAVSLFLAYGASRFDMRDHCPRKTIEPTSTIMSNCFRL